VNSAPVQHGTLAAVPALEPAPPAALASAPAGATAQGIDWPWKGVKWTLIYVGVLGYIYAITTYEFPIATASMVVALAGMLVQRGKIRFPAPVAFLLLFLAWAAAGVAMSQFGEAAWAQWIDLLKIFLVMLVVVNALRTTSQIRFFIIFFLGFFALYPVRGALLNYYVFHYTLLGRAIWNYAYENPNDLAAYCLLHLGLVLGILATEPNVWLRRAAIIGAGLLPFLLFLTQSRGALIALGIFGLIVALGHRRALRRVLGTKQRRRIAAGLAATVVVVVLFAPSAVWGRLSRLSKLTSVETVAQADDERSAEGRLEIWRVASQVARDNFALGVGIGAYPFVHQQYVKFVTHSQVGRGQRDTHSTYLRVLTETGIFGLLIFGGMLVSLFAYVNRIRRKARDRLPRRALQLYYMQAGLIGFLFAGVFGTFLYLHFFYICMALLWCLATDLDREMKESVVGAAVPAASARRRRGLAVAT
jgi:O-antigen ligase